jgi:dihydroxy-acid dehydratase
MSSVLETLGLSLPYSSSTPATFDRTSYDAVHGDPTEPLIQLPAYARFEEKLKECSRAAGYLKKLLERDIKPRYARHLIELACQHMFRLPAATS